MKIVADNDIPWVQQYFAPCGELLLKPGRGITRADVADADMLLVRSITPVNQALLLGSTVNWVGTATTGIDHLDTEWLEAAGIQWAAASGCNTRAVVEYILCVIAVLQQRAFLPQEAMRVGVIGAGRIGGQLAAIIPGLKATLLVSDPPRALSDSAFQSVPLADFVDLDLITVHVPFTQQGPYATAGLIDSDLLKQQRPGTVIINTSRGDVLAAGAAQQYGQHLHWVHDVWRHEPTIDLTLLAAALIATPHIAGHTIQSKQRATSMLYQAACRQGFLPSSELPVLVDTTPTLVPASTTEDWRDILLQIFDPWQATALMKEALTNSSSVGAAFDHLRKMLGVRQEFAGANIKGLDFLMPNKPLFDRRL